MASLNSPYFMVKIFVSFFIAIAFGVVCKAKQDKPFKTLCERTPYPKTCYNSLANWPPLDSNNGYNSILLYNLSIQDSINEVSRSLSEDFSEDGSLTRMIDKSLQSAIRSCQELLSLALYNLNLSMSTPTRDTILDFRTWLSATIADLDTCVDGFEYAPEEARKLVIEKLDSSNKLVSNSLSIISQMFDSPGDPGSVIGRVGSRNDWPPAWLSPEDRKLLDDSEPTMTHDVVVAADGSGNYRTINEAIKVAPQNSERRFVVYVKEGIYYENVNIDMTKWNVMMFGDGMNKTIVSGSISNSSGATTLTTATFGVQGIGFIARDMGFRNTAGPAMKQAVALLSSSDKSVIYRCSIDGYQDTLFTLSNRQFYRESHIYGTIDFIFGQSAAVFQNCTILVKKPLHGQMNAITAQGKSNPNVISGFSIQNCEVVAAEDLAGARTFLGRPWKNFSTTIFMDSFLDSLIDAAGWLSWEPNVAPPDTIYYVEYNNRGAGAVTSNRVPWKGVRVNITVEEAMNFTVKEFINGVEWIREAGVPFQPGL